MKLRVYPQHPIVVVDDEEDFLRLVKDTLVSGGFTNLELLQDGRELPALLAQIPVDLVLLDMMMPGVTGEALLDGLAADFPGLPVVMVTAVDDVSRAVACMKKGAFDYLVKPVDADRLVSTVRSAVRVRESEQESEALRSSLKGSELGNPKAFSHIVTADSSMYAAFRYLEAVATSPRAVLITGETGVGKEGVARALHNLSGRPGELVQVNAAGIDDNMFADTLFGHRKGAFTGADTARAGLIEKAEGGTLFLDEIGDLGPSSQVKLLQLLQDGSYLPLGSDMPKVTDARVVAATNCDLAELQREGQFRRDLFYRLSSHHVRLPPLRERRGDLPLLVEHFVDQAAKQIDKPPPAVPRELLVLLSSYRFPGNIRELEAMVADAVSLSRGTVLSTKSFLEKVTPGDRSSGEDDGQNEAANGSLSFPDPLPTMKQTEWALIDEALERAQGNQGIAAAMLGMTRQALNNRLKRRDVDGKG